MNKKPIILIWLMCSLSAGLIGQARGQDPVTSSHRVTGGVEGKTAASNFAVTVYNDHTVRVRVSKKPLDRSFSYALLSNKIPDTAHFHYNDKPDSIEISTGDILVVIQKKPAFRVIFKNIRNEVINEDMPGQGFGTHFAGEELTIYKKLQPGERFVGLGEALGNLDRRGSGVTLNNTDNYKYGDPRIPMYSSIPFYIGVLPDNVYGLFLNNSYKSFFNFGLSTPGYLSISAEGGDADYFFFHDSSVAGVIKNYTDITGTMPLPPRWSLGYNQSRCSYYPQDKVLWIAETFRRKNIPIDGITLDADYLQDYEPFRINKKRFPDMSGLAASLSNMNIELTASVNPGIRIDSSYDAYLDGLKKKIFITYPDGSNFTADIAPNTNHFPDFTNPRVRDWWVDQMKFLPDNGIHGYWNDMNEPAVSGSYLPDNLVFDFDGRKTDAREAKNVYGLLMARSSYESGLKYGNGKRPFVLTRSGFAGVQRYSAMWSGDNQATDAQLLLGQLLNLQLGLSGVPFVGPDLGGYIGDGNKDLFRRWIEVGVFSPFLRNHREFFGAANEPWAYGEEVEALAKAYIGLRYRLMPYIYAKFYEASRTGMPIARSLCLNYPFDTPVYNESFQYQFLFGDALLVVPVTSQEKYKRIFLPEGAWYDLFTDSLINGGKEITCQIPRYKIPLFVRGSSIIPMQSLVQSTRQAPSDTLLLHIYKGAEKNSFTYYEDDGKSMDYKNAGYFRRQISFDPLGKKITIAAVEGNFASHFKFIELIFHGFGDTVNRLSTAQGKLESKTAPAPLFDPLADLEDYYDKNYFQSLRAAERIRAGRSVTIGNSRGSIELNY